MSCNFSELPCVIHLVNWCEGLNLFLSDRKHKAFSSDPSRPANLEFYGSVNDCQHLSFDGGELRDRVE